MYHFYSLRAISQVATTYSPYGIVVDATNEKLLGLSVVECKGNINRWTSRQWRMIQSPS